MWVRRNYRNFFCFLEKLRRFKMAPCLNGQCDRPLTSGRPGFQSTCWVFLLFIFIPIPWSFFQVIGNSTSCLLLVGVFILGLVVSLDYAIFGFIAIQCLSNQLYYPVHIDVSSVNHYPPFEQLGGAFVLRVWIICEVQTWISFNDW